MTRGCRTGKVKKEELRDRLAPSAARNGGVLPPASAPLPELLGHALHYGLLSEREVEETVPRVEKTIPCYLLSRLGAAPPAFLDSLERYVVVASELYRRQGLIANLIAQKLCGGRVPVPAGGAQKFSMPAAAASSAALRNFCDPPDVRNSAFKQLFLPERWPTDGVPRDALISGVLEDFAAVLPPAPDWRGVTSTTGWDNAINRAATKYHGNIQVQACVRMPERVRAYLRVVRVDEGTDRRVLEEVATRILRPMTCISSGDFKMAMHLRDVLGAPDDFYPPRNAPWGAEAFALHVFLVRHGPRETTYLPVFDRGRKYCYVDAKIAGAMLPKHSEHDNDGAPKKKRERKRQEGDAVQAPEPASSVCIGDLLGLTPESFNAKSKELRATTRRILRKRAKRRGTSRKFKERLKKRQAALRTGKMPRNARVDSIETDGVGLRICVKTPVDMSPFILPLPSVAEKAAAKAAATATEPKRRKRASGLGGGAKRCDASAGPCPSDGSSASEEGPQTLCSFVGVDPGRKKLLAAAISRPGGAKPETFMFTRARYYSEMGYWRHQAWCKDRASVGAVRTALDSLARAGGLKNCVPELWRATLEVEREHDAPLRREFLESKEYALWRMRLFRKKKRSLDHAAHGLLSRAVEGQPSGKPLILGVGSATMAATGRGELSAPTSSLNAALRRAVSRIRERGRKVVWRDVWEFRTTMCCCACGAVTAPAQVAWRDARGALVLDPDGVPKTRPSRRLRSCTSCETTGKLRDRDVQAARNILWLTQHEYFGAERPQYMCRVGGVTSGRRPRRRLNAMAPVVEH